MVLALAVIGCERTGPFDQTQEDGHMKQGISKGRSRRLAVVFGAAAMVAGSFTVGAISTVGVATAGAATSFKACVVTDTGGINDKSFNASAWQGLKDAKKADKNISISYLSSTSSSDYIPNISKFIKEDCGIIVTVGFLMDSATATLSNNHLKQKFAIVDDVPPTKSKNVLALTYDTNQGAFLSGYLAAAETKTGTVATFGGANIPPVTIYMDGFVAGVRYFNKQNGKSVKVLGWTPTPGRAAGSFAGTGDFVGNFTDQTAGQTLTAGDFAAGADIVFPVAGSVGLGAVAAAKAAGTGHKIIWVDTDGCINDAPDCSWFLSSATKGVEPSVDAAVLAAAKGTFKGGTYVGTLKNNGTGTTVDSPSVSASLKAELKTLTAGIEKGTISVDPTTYPAS